MARIIKPALLALGLLLAGACVAAAAAEGSVPSYAAELDASTDPRLSLPVSVVAYRTSIRSVLSALTRVTGVHLAPGSPAVGDEPVIVFIRNRPLRSALRLLAEEFRWGEGGKFGWFWKRQTSTGATEYALYQDRSTQMQPEEMRQLGRRQFAEDLDTCLKRYRHTDRTRADSMDVAAALPDGAWQQALAGRPGVLKWNQMTERLRDLARMHLAGFTEAGPDTRAEVEAFGEGESLTIRILFATTGRGGAGPRIQPQAYQQRFARPHLWLKPGRKLPNKTYTGLAAGPMALDKEELAKWASAQTAPDILDLISQKMGIDIVCDDYDYGVHWSSGSRSPAGEPLGLWLDALEQALRSSHNIDGCNMRWREVEGSVLVRNAGWYYDDALRPPAEIRRWLRELRRKSPEYVLSLADVARILAANDDYQLGALTRTGLLPQARELRTFRGYLPVIATLTSAQRARWFSPAGLSVAELSPAQREAASAEGPGRHPNFSEETFRTQPGGQLSFSMVMQPDGTLAFTIRSPTRSGKPILVDLRLPAKDPEVCRVTRGQSS